MDMTQKTAQEFGITVYQPFCFFKRGKVVEQIIGAVPKQQIVDKLDATLVD